MKDQLTQDELESWKHNPITKKIKKYMIDYRESIIETWADGALLKDTAEAQLSLTAQSIATCRTLKDLVNLDYEDLAQFYGWELTLKEEEKAND